MSTNFDAFSNLVCDLVDYSSRHCSWHIAQYWMSHQSLRSSTHSTCVPVMGKCKMFQFLQMKSKYIVMENIVMENLNNATVSSITYIYSYHMFPFGDQLYSW